MSYCTHCGHSLSERAAACPACGEPNRRGLNPKSRGVAIILALVGGGFGFHRFYLGHVGLGIVYLLLCWTLLPMILACFEIIYWCFLSNERFQEKYS